MRFYARISLVYGKTSGFLALRKNLTEQAFYAAF
jgi:hypothetical protein